MIYRIQHIKLHENVTFSNLLVTTCLGWLMEQPHLPMGFYFKQLPAQNDLEDSFVKDAVFENNTIDDLVTRDLFYSCCPYFGKKFQFQFPILVRKIVLFFIFLFYVYNL